MEFGLQFFPDVSPEQKSGHQYWNECLSLVDLCDELGYTQVRTVEHYFEPYGGYSPAPHVFLTAASQRTSKARLLTGAVLPVFNHPLKVAGEIGMLDAISGGRLDCGFGRAFLPHEFQRFERSMDESRARFEEGMEAVRLLLEIWPESLVWRDVFQQRGRRKQGRCQDLTRPRREEIKDGRNGICTGSAAAAEIAAGPA